MAIYITVQGHKGPFLSLLAIQIPPIIFRAVFYLYFALLLLMVLSELRLEGKSHNMLSRGESSTLMWAC